MLFSHLTLLNQPGCFTKRLLCLAAAHSCSGGNRAANPLERPHGSVEHDPSAGRERDVGDEPAQQDCAGPWARLAGATEHPLCYKYKSQVKKLAFSASPTALLAKSPALGGGK